jgi:hypothetical protein
LFSYHICNFNECVTTAETRKLRGRPCRMRGIERYRISRTIGWTSIDIASGKEAFGAPCRVIYVG